MNKKQKTMLWRIITAAVLMVALHFVPVTGLPRFALYMVPYLIVATISSRRRRWASGTARYSMKTS